MKLEDQVCSLELSKRLRELGLKQDSLFVWRKTKYNNSQPIVSFLKSYDDGMYEIEGWEIVAPAYTATELGEILPKLLQIGNEITVLQSLNAGNWIVYYGSTNGTAEIVNDEQVSAFADTECNARAKMLIHLLENHLISVEELGK